MNIQKINLEEKLNSFSEHWSPKIVAELNHQLVKVAKFKGEFVMHHHEHEDELFYVIAGELFIQLADKTLRLHPGECVVIPKGIAHKPYAPEEAHVMLFEPAATLNTGNINNERTVPQPDKI